MPRIIWSFPAGLMCTPISTCRSAAPPAPTFSKHMRRAANHPDMFCMHAKNGGPIDAIVHKPLAEGGRAPKYHALTRPTTAEAEATGRAIALAEMAGAPVYIVHLSCNEALE